MTGWLTRFRRLKQDRRGVATLELAMSLPLLGVMLLGAVEFVTYSWAVGRVHDASASIGDLVSRNETVNDAFITGVFRAADVVIEGDRSLGDSSTLEVIVTSTISCYCDDSETSLCYYALWSHKYSKGNEQVGYSQGAKLGKIPSNLAQRENENIIYTETTYDFKPDINLVLPNELLSLSDQSFFRPRKSSFVEHTGSQAPGTAITCANIEEQFGITLTP